MAERNYYGTPMEYEYENKHGEVDLNSPFIKNIPQPSSFSTSRGDLGSNWRLQNDIEQRKATQKRAFAQYESPLKAEAPALRPPGQGQTVLFSQPPDTNKRLPPSPSRNSLWATPRKSREVVDSSGGETPDTENWKADSEDTPGTPSMGFRKNFSKTLNFLGGSGRKNSVEGKEMVVKGSPTAGRGDIPKPYSQKAAMKVQKKRDKGLQAKRRKLVREAVESETEADTEVEHYQNPKASGAKGGSFDFGSFFHYIESHPNLPHVLSFYAQLMLNLFLVFGIMFLIYSFWSTIRSDVDKKSQEAMSEVLAEIAVCAKHWKDNQCDRGSVLPALESVCREWEKCMNKDHKSIGRARISAHTFAEIFNSFIEPISWKAMGFIVLTIVASFGITNGVFSLFRRNVAPQPYQHMPPPPTPQRHPSWNQDPQYGFTPYGSYQAIPGPQFGQQYGLEPAPSQGSQGSPRKIRGAESPRKFKSLEL